VRRTLPAGLVTKLQESGSSASDFLSSLEVVIIDHADVIMMQNWQHVQTLFQNCNKLPKVGGGGISAQVSAQVSSHVSKIVAAHVSATRVCTRVCTN
jgi:hypothetical protein